MTVTINVRRRDGLLAGQESQFSKLSLVQRHQDTGSWAITTPDTLMANELSQPGAGISVRREGQTFLSGPTTKVERTFSSTSDQFVISGLSDECKLWDRLVLPSSPEPTDTGLYQFEKSDDFSGVAETVIKYYVQNNLGDAARTPNGAEPLDTAPDQGRGLQVVGSGRFTLLGDFINTFATFSDNMGVSIKDNVFDVYEPQDRSNAALFSTASGNLLSYSYSFAAPKVTHPYVGGNGNLSQRLFYLGEDDAAADLWGRRVESFVNAQSTSDPTSLAQQAKNAITNGASQTAVKMQPIDVPNRTFGVDYGLGDIVNINGVIATISQVELTLDQDGETILPTGSTASAAAAQAVLAMFDDLRIFRRQLLDVQTSI